MKKSSYWKETLECYGLMGVVLIPFWAAIIVGAELSVDHFVEVLLSYF
ncbi:hypothetical protein ABFG93_13765 [Pseudalkalibacillus hwajinpoensis]